MMLTFAEYLKTRGLSLARVEAMPPNFRAHFYARYLEQADSEAIADAMISRRASLPKVCESSRCPNLRAPGKMFCAACLGTGKPVPGEPSEEAEDLEGEASRVAAERAEELQRTYVKSAAQRETLDAGGPPVGKPVPQPSGCLSRVETYLAITAAAIGVIVAGLIVWAQG